MTYRRFHVLACSLVLVGCSDDGGAGALGGNATTGGTTAPVPATTDDGESTGEPGSGPSLLCADGAPLQGGNANWDTPPFEPPAPGDADDEGDSDSDSEGDWTGGAFITDPDGGGVSVECSIWDQDCQRGEKCAPWANDGGTEQNATRCAPVAMDPAQPGDACAVEGSGVSGIDDCDVAVLCYEVDEKSLEGTCVQMCQGSEAEPQCPEGTWCSIMNEGVLSLCLPDELCVEDEVCQCMCGDAVDPDCEEGQCDPEEPPPVIDPLDLRSAPVTEADSMCPESLDPVVLYQSNDDSNSQASPALARWYIENGGVIPPDRVRIHEFLNYYDLSYDNPTDVAAKVGIQMRRTNPDSGEFTLMISARGREMSHADRPPINLVFSVDTSGSMGGVSLDLAKEAMLAAAGELRAGDIVSMVNWSTDQSVLLDGYEVQGPDDPELIAAISPLGVEGGTDLHAGLVAAYQLANAHHIEGGINRVMLLSDGGANAGVTDIDLIASESADNDGEGTYLMGVGVGSGYSYSDRLMDEVTDAGKGSYVFLDRPGEAEHMLGDRFLANTMIVARNVQTRLTLPWYFGVKAFHGEEYSDDPAEVEPQHLGPNDTMTFHQIISACDPGMISDCDSIQAHIEYTDPLTGAQHSDERTVAIEDVVIEQAGTLRKADVVVGYAKALIVIGVMVNNGNQEGAAEVASNMATWVQNAAASLGDPEVNEIAELLAAYEATLSA